MGHKTESQGLWYFPIVRNSKYQKTQRFGNWIFPSSGERKETPTLLIPLEGTNLNHWIDFD
jgi:hypothetical protein